MSLKKLCRKLPGFDLNQHVLLFFPFTSDKKGQACLQANALVLSVPMHCQQPSQITVLNFGEGRSTGWQKSMTADLKRSCNIWKINQEGKWPKF